MASSKLHVLDAQAHSRKTGSSKSTTELRTVASDFVTHPPLPFVEYVCALALEAIILALLPMVVVISYLMIPFSFASFYCIIIIYSIKCLSVPLLFTVRLSLFDFITSLGYCCIMHVNFVNTVLLVL